MKKLRDIFPGKETVFIAEIGINHNGDAGRALSMIDAASAAGADAVKFQTFVPEMLYSKQTTALLKNGQEGGEDTSQIDLFSRFVLGPDDYRMLKKRADELGLVFFSSAFDDPSIELLENVGVQLYKIASSEVTNVYLLERIASRHKPVILSTGICTESEIGAAIEMLVTAGAPDIALLHCVSMYPLDPDHANLSRIISLRSRFGVSVGFSDHSKSVRIAAAAAAAGARIFEHHFMLAGDNECPDASVSLDPSAYAVMKRSVLETVRVMGDGHIDYDLYEKDVAKSARKSLFSRKFIPAGKILDTGDIIARRPGVGIPASLYRQFVGKRSNQDIPEDRLLRMEQFE
jgi:N,N'-diacetyllegionaminate synthase